jgi:hypothetical protein
MSVNHTYGIISNSDLSLRFSDHSPTERQKKLLGDLWEKVDNKAALAELLIRLLKCSSYWTAYCDKYDPMNTYHIPVGVPKCPITLADLIEWANNCPVKSNEYLYENEQIALDRICNKLLGVLTLK